MYQNCQKFSMIPHSHPQSLSAEFKFLNSLFWVSSFLFVLLWFLPTTTFGARIYFEPQEATVGTEGTFFVAVLLDSREDTINALSVSIDVPEEFVPTDTRDGDSIISLWIDKPKWNEETRKLTFSGLIPGGFLGTYAHLLTIELSPTGRPGNSILSFDSEETILLRNSANAEEVTLDLESITLLVIKGKENLPVVIIDTDPPEGFVPFITGYKQAFDGNYVVVFSTQDKKSGICCYFVAEMRGREVHDYTGLTWKEAESPYTLEDQSLRSFVYVKAIDKESNETIAIVSPQSTVSGYVMSHFIGILITIAVVLISTLIYVRRRRHEQNIF